MVRLLSRYPLAWLIGFLFLAAILFMNRPGVAPTALATHAPVAGQPVVPATKPIEQLQVGERVLARNPEVSEEERASWEEPNWETWLKLSLQMPVWPPNSSAGDEPKMLNIEILRPESWLLERLEFQFALKEDVAPEEWLQGASPTDEYCWWLGPELDGSNADELAQHLPLSPVRPAYRELLIGLLLAEEANCDFAAAVDLDLPEMGASGLAYITDVQPCPPVESGNGQVVSATFRHPPWHQVLDVTLEGSDQPIGVTDNHRFWSADQEIFLPIREMAIGEQVVTYAGETRRIVSKLPRSGPEAVYNLEVDGEHVYFVSGQGILAHNTYPPTGLTSAQKAAVRELVDAGYNVRTAIRLIKGKPLNELDVVPYGRSYGSLPAHEVLNNAFLEVRKYISKRGVGSPSINNPSILLDRQLHDSTIKSLQHQLGVWYKRDLKNLTRTTMIRRNLDVLRGAGISEEVVQQVRRVVVIHARSIGRPR